jgi:hypothetical protein
MAAQGRIVLFSWVSAPAATRTESRPLGPPRTTGGPSPASRGITSPPRGGALIGWRAIGANNRELGRGAHPSRSVDEACQALQAARLTFGRQVARVTLDAEAGWSWHISLDAEPLAVSARRYHRQRECEYSLEQFRAQFPSAEVVTPSSKTSRLMRRGAQTVAPFPGRRPLDGVGRTSQG